MHCSINPATTKTAVRVRAVETYDWQSHVLEIVCCKHPGRKINLSLYRSLVDGDIWYVSSRRSQTDLGWVRKLAKSKGPPHPIHGVGIPIRPCWNNLKFSCAWTTSFSERIVEHSRGYYDSDCSDPVAGPVRPAGSTQDP